MLKCLVARHLGWKGCIIIANDTNVDRFHKVMPSNRELLHAANSEQPPISGLSGSHRREWVYQSHYCQRNDEILMSQINLTQDNYE